ncbi:MAG: type II toxin-antitoxin system VapC family toxin [Prochlorotrichaceae cyanobacterium]|jgi:predicted nucleic acid-binding protein
MSEKIFVDTWGWLTLHDRKEYKHPEVVEIYRGMLASKSKIHTSTFVLDETFTLFFKRLNVEQAKQSMIQLSSAFESNFFELVEIDRLRFKQTESLRIKYLDKPRIPFTDLSSMVVMQEYKIKKIITEDDHFNQVGLGFECIPLGRQ